MRNAGLAQEEPARHVPPGGSQLHRSAKIDDLLALKDDVIAATKKQAGFVSFQGGVSRATGAFITVSTWETEAAGKLPLREVLGEILDRLTALGLQVKSVDTYELTWSV